MRRSPKRAPVRGSGRRNWTRTLGRASLAAAAFAFGYVAFLYLTLPDVRALRTRNPASTAFIDLRAREARTAGREPRHLQHWQPYSRISPNLKRAVLVAEDAGFWGHEGIDLVEIRKSLETDWEKGALLRGASTITQQLAKNLYLSPSRNPFRKLRELYITRRLEYRAHQDEDSRAVLERNRVGRRDLWRRCGGARLFRHLRGVAQPRAGGAHGGSHREPARAERRAAERAAPEPAAHHPGTHGPRHAAASGRDAG